MAGTPDTTNTNPWNAYQREYRKRHPEVVKKSRITYSIKLLRDNGYTVIPPEDKPQENQQKA